MLNILLEPECRIGMAQAVDGSALPVAVLFDPDTANKVLEPLFEGSNWCAVPVSKNGFISVQLLQACLFATKLLDPVKIVFDRLLSGNDLSCSSLPLHQQNYVAVFVLIN